MEHVEHIFLVWHGLGQSAQLVFGLLMVLQVLDVQSTRLALQLGFRELNPLARWLMTLMGIVPGLIATKALMLVVFATLFMGTELRQLELNILSLNISLACCVYVSVVICNLWHISDELQRMPARYHGARALIRMLVAGRMPS
jgi:hypothetical protein